MARSEKSLDVSELIRRKRSVNPLDLEEARRKGATLLENLIIEPDNFAVLYALCQVYTIHDLSHDDEEKSFLAGVVEILLEHDSLLPFLHYVVKREVGECQEPNALFRARTVFTLLFADLISRRPCMKFLNECCGFVVDKVIKSKHGWETDLCRVETGPKLSSGLQKMSYVTKNAQKLVALADALLANVKKNFNKCPPSLRKIFEMVAALTALKYPELKWKIVGSLFFLRFLNPALCSPEKYELVSREITPQSRKGLVTVSKMLMATANGNLLTVDDSPGNVVLNTWIEPQIEGLEQLFSQLVEVQMTDWKEADIAKTPREGSPRVKVKNFGEKVRFALNNKSFLQPSDKMGAVLTAEQSFDLRLRVLDALIANQVKVKELLSGDMSALTQWMWLKEALETFL